MALRISLAMIAKDEEQNLAQCLPTIVPYVDDVVIVDTGSADNTREVAKSFGARVYQFDQYNHPECFFLDTDEACRQFGYDVPNTYSGEIAFADFGAARNESWKHATGDFVLWVDADDVVEGGQNLRRIVEDLARKPDAFGFLKYDYARDDLGRTFYSQWRERIVPRDMATWSNPVHEVLLPKQPIVPVRYDDILIVHRRKPDRKQIPNRNYKILLRQLKGELDAKRDVDPRTLFYLGQEARFIEPMRAIGFYEEYLKKSGWNEERAAAHCALGQIYEFGQSGLPVDESYARANLHFAAAAMELENNPDGLFGAARIAYLRGRYNDCIRFSERGLTIGNTDSMLGMNPMDRLYRPHAYLNHSYAQMGRIEDALKSCNAALSVAPDDPGVPGGASGMIALNKKVYEEALMRDKQAPTPEPSKAVAVLSKDEDLRTPPPANVPRDAYVIWTIFLWKKAVATGDASKARALLDGLHPDIEEDPKIKQLRDETDRLFGPRPPDPKDVSLKLAGIIKRATDEMAGLLTGQGPPLVTGSQSAGGAGGGLKCASASPAAVPSPSPSAAGGALSIVIWTGPAFEPWDPTTPNTKGIGGSETACCEIAKNLVALGHRVTVYGDCEKTAGIYDGVTYRHWQTFDRVDCDVFVSSRQPSIMAANDRINAKLRLLWVHDIHCGPATPDMERWLLRFDRVLCLSKWHRDFFLSCYPTLHQDRVVVTRNGIDPERFSPKPTAIALSHKKNSLVFSSSPNRGLASILSMFPAIRAQVPDAELHIAYGLDCWKALAAMRKDPDEQAVIKKYEDMIADAQKQGGVFYHGRIDQQKLADLFMFSKVWLYPTLGPELFPETYCISALEAMAAGAVPVTTAHAGLIETVKHGFLFDPNSPTTPAQMVHATVRLLTNESERATTAEAGRSWALTQSWSSLASEWANAWKKWIADVSYNPIQIWRSA